MHVLCPCWHQIMKYEDLIIIVFDLYERGDCTDA